MDMEQRDYDSRTALHVAAAEGRKCMNHLELLQTETLLETNGHLLCFGECRSC